MRIEPHGVMQAFLDRAYEHRFRNFLVLLVLYLITLPLDDIAGWEWVPMVFISLAIVAGSLAMSRERVFIRLAILIAVPAIFARWINLAFYSEAGDISGAIFFIMFFGLTGVFLLRTLFRSERITGDTILGAISIYLLIGITFAFAYQMVDLTHPGSFQYDTVIRPAGLVLNDFIYYSFITMATVGYGDIVPIPTALRTIAYFEALIGSIYIVVFIAKMVSAYKRD